MSERPTRVKTWAPKGQTPVLQFSFAWKQMSVIAGISFWNFYFRFHAGAIRGPQFIEFLQALCKQVRGKLLDRMTTRYRRCDLGPNPSLNADVPRAGLRPPKRSAG